MNITNKTRSRINIAVTLVAVFVMVATPFASDVQAFGWDSGSVDYGTSDWNSGSIDYSDYGWDSGSIDYGDYGWDSGSIDYSDYGWDSGSIDYSDYGWDSGSIDYGDYGWDSGVIDYGNYNWDSGSIDYPTPTNTCGSNCYPTLEWPTYTYPTPCVTCYPTPTYPTPTYPTPCRTNCTPTVIYPIPGDNLNNNDNDNDNDNDNVNNNNLDNENVNNININIEYPNITYPDINIVNNNTNNNGGTDSTPQCGNWNNWCQPQQNSSVFLNADNTNLQSGQSTVLRWTGTNVNSCFASNGWSGTKSTSGTESTNALFSDRTYVINCTGTNGQNVTDSVTVFVSGFNQNFPSVDITADQTFLTSGQATILRWVSSNANSCFATSGWSGSKSTIGSESTGALFTSRTYVINCTGFNGQNVSDSVTVNVSGSNLPNETNTVVTQSPTGITTNSGILNGLAINNQSSFTTMWFEYGTSVGLGSDTPRQSVGVVSGSRSFSWTLAGLSPNTTYFYRAVSETSTGVARGLILSFTTGGVLGISTGPVASGAKVSIDKTLENRTTPNGSDAKVTAWPGDEVRYTITVENTGDTTLRNLTVVDELPSTIVYVDGGSYDSDTDKVIWSIDRLNVGETKTLFLDTMVTECACAVDKSNIDNVAYVTGSQISKKTSSAATVSVSQNNLVMTLDADRNQVNSGDVVNFALTISNGGEEMLDNGSVRVILPDTLTFRNASGAYRENSNVYTFEVDSLRVNRDVVINISAEVKDNVTSGEDITVSAVSTFEDSDGNDIVSDIDETINVSGGANVAAAAGLAGFFPDSFVGWLLLIILAVILILLIRWLIVGTKKEDEDKKDSLVHSSHGVMSAPVYRTPSAYDQKLDGRGNGANAVAFDQTHAQNQAVNDLAKFTNNGHDLSSNFPNNLPR